MRNLNSLIPKELQVVKLLAKGYSRDKVLKIMHISKRTLDAYFGFINEKICDNSKSNLIVNIIRNALLKNIISVDDLKEENF